jgi:hypothetical protein
VTPNGRVSYFQNRSVTAKNGSVETLLGRRLESCTPGLTLSIYSETMVLRHDVDAGVNPLCHSTIRLVCHNSHMGNPPLEACDARTGMLALA